MFGRKLATEETEAELEQRRRELREARLKAARTQANWSEITPAERLIPRGPSRFSWLVDAADDRLWTPTRGSVFLPGSASIAATHTHVTFYVTPDDDVVALEPAPVSTWSEVVKRRPDLVTAAS